jgi:hypothetical protein
MYREKMSISGKAYWSRRALMYFRRKQYWRERALAAEKELKQMKELEKNRLESVSRCCK